MQTETHTQKATHRWVVAAPLFVLFLCLSMRDSFTNHSLHADVTASGSIAVDAHADPQTVTQNGVQYQLQPGSHLQLSSVPVLQTGTALVFAAGMSSLQAGGLQIEGWNGGFQVTASTIDITIATLTTPVLVSDGTAQMILPPLMQWTGHHLRSKSEGLAAWYASRRTLPLPTDFSHDELLAVSALASSAASSDSSVSPLVAPSIGQALRLNAAQERADALVRKNRLAALAQALTTDPASVDALLLEPDTQAVLTSAEGQAALPSLLSLALQNGKGDLFLSFFAHQPDLFLLAAFHPQTRDHARILPRPMLTDDEMLSLLLFTPASDTAPDALAPLAMEEWQAAWMTFVQTQSGASVFADALPLLQAQISHIDTLQYAARVDAYITALLAIADPIEQRLTPDARHTLEAIRAFRAERRLAAPLADVASSASSVAVSSSSASSVHAILPDAELVSQTESLLQQSGFMVTTQTAFRPDQGVVDVSSIVFGTAKGDTTLQFHFDPVTQTVSNIEQDGQILPYSIGLQGFIDWLKTK